MGGHVLGLIHTVTMLDVIDILVVAFFLNKLYQMLKNTRAASLVKGLLMLLVIMLITPGMAISVYLIPVWIAVLGVGYMFSQKSRNAMKAH